MEKLKFNISVDASREKVWNVLWGDTYEAWTSAFSEGSRIETDWKKGSKVLFLDGNNEGMVSTIADKIPNEFMSFKHLGTVKDGVEDLNSEAVKGWAGSLENYTLKTVDGKTQLSIDMDVTEDHKDIFLKAWPKALDIVKKLAEQSA